MKTIKHDHAGLFRNEAAYFQHFAGDLIASNQIELEKLQGKRIAIIGTDQHIVSQLHQICAIAESVQVFQITQPQWVLPKTPNIVQSLIHHPLVIKNRRLFSQRIKSLIALRFLDREILNPWLKRQLTPNQANLKKDFLKSDHYYQALQATNCQLNTWPIKTIHQLQIDDLQGKTYFTDQIITTYK